MPRRSQRAQHSRRCAPPRRADRLRSRQPAQARAAVAGGESRAPAPVASQARREEELRRFRRALLASAARRVSRGAREHAVRRGHARRRAMSWSLRFLGVGNAQAAPVLGSASAVVERNGAPFLMIDCGQEALSAYLDRYGTPPRAVYITHTHMDHVGGLERLFYKIYFEAKLRGSIKIYAHAALVPYLQARVADYPEVLAEGGANFWDAFALVPVSRGFWHDGVWFDVFATRHHAPNTSFGLSLESSFVWTGDTRPIPEMLAHYAAHAELVAHDCALAGNPSH